jgi:hypothetical protein
MTLARGRGFTVKLVITVMPELEAVRVTTVVTNTLLAVTRKLTEMDPCGTVMVPGTPTAVLSELVSNMTTPFVPAGAERLMVPVPVCPLKIEVGFTEMALSVMTKGLMVVLAVLFTPEYEAVSVATVVTVTVPAAIGKVADCEPCGLVTDEATPAACGFELDSATTAPPLPAGEVSVTVPVPDWPLVI